MRALLLLLAMSLGCGSDVLDRPNQHDANPDTLDPEDLAAKLDLIASSPELLAAAEKEHELTEEEHKLVAAFWIMSADAHHTGEFIPQLFGSDLIERVADLAKHYPKTLAMAALHESDVGSVSQAIRPGQPFSCATSCGPDFREIPKAAWEAVDDVVFDGILHSLTRLTKAAAWVKGFKDHGDIAVKSAQSLTETLDVADSIEVVGTLGTRYGKAWPWIKAASIAGKFGYTVGDNVINLPLACLEWKETNCLCGNGVVDVDAGEVCDGNCLNFCDDGDPCTVDFSLPDAKDPCRTVECTFITRAGEQCEEPKDCMGRSGGSAFVDKCGKCVGGLTGLEACVPPCTSDADCAHLAAEDYCVAVSPEGVKVTYGEPSCVAGTCKPPPLVLAPDESCIVRDCAQVVNGLAFLDTCDRCVGGTTGETPCECSSDSDCAYLHRDAECLNEADLVSYTEPSCTNFECVPPVAQTELDACNLAPYESAVVGEWAASVYVQHSGFAKTHRQVLTADGKGTVYAKIPEGQDPATLCAAPAYKYPINGYCEYPVRWYVEYDIKRKQFFLQYSTATTPVLLDPITLPLTSYRSWHLWTDGSLIKWTYTKVSEPLATP